MPVLVASGYIDPAADAALSHHHRVGFLEKPFLMEEIQQALTRFF